jgi:hypothetical protein
MYVALFGPSAEPDLLYLIYHHIFYLYNSRFKISIAMGKTNEDKLVFYTMHFECKLLVQ